MLLLDVGKKRNCQIINNFRVGELVMKRILGRQCGNPGLCSEILFNIFIGVIIHLGIFFRNFIRILLYLHALNRNLYAISSLT